MNLDFLKEWRPATVKLTVVESGATNVEHQENYYDGRKKLAEADSGDVFDTDEARTLWKLATEQGWVDDDRQPVLSQPKAAILASVMGDALHLSPKWAPFETLWRIPDLANKLSHAQNCQYYAETLKDFESVLT